MNFIKNNSRSGFCDDHVTAAPSPSSSSSSSSPSSISAAPPLTEENIQREHMFDKVVTPSDVGKLNRLVIPKQHAERYFPLDSTSGDRGGLLLSFEECRTGKLWRFRYSYWNSSQSYVMTKGWSRFVKDKRLNAGDVVSFQRTALAVAGADRRLFIDWRHTPPDGPPIIPSYQFPYHQPSVHPWSPLLVHPPPARDYSTHFLQASAGYYYSTRNPRPPPAQVQSLMQLQFPAAEMLATPQQSGTAHHQVVFNAVPVVQGRATVAATAKRLRLFGVNLDCAISESDGCDPPSSPTHNTTMLLLPPSPSSSTFAKPDEDEDKGKGSMSLDLDM